MNLSIWPLASMPHAQHLAVAKRGLREGPSVRNAARLDQKMITRLEESMFVLGQVVITQRRVQQVFVEVLQEYAE